MLEFARWKYIVVVLVSLLALVFAAPNFFGEDLAVQVLRKDRAAIDAVGSQAIEDALKAKGVAVKRAFIDSGRTMLLFDEVSDQLAARDTVNETLSNTYVSALSSAPRAPEIFRKMGLRPMPLGLDLRGGLYLLYQVDVNGAVRQLIDSYEQDYRRALTSAKITFTDAAPLQEEDGTITGVRVTFPQGANLSAARDVMQKVVTDATYTIGGGTVPSISATLTTAQITERKRNAIQQNMVTLRNRVGELGVTEPEVRQQGVDRISVALPGITNSAEVKDILGKVATLEFRLTDVANSAQEAVNKGRAPIGSRIYYHREQNGFRQPTLLKREVIATGDQLVDATSTATQDGPGVAIRLDSQAGDEMLRITQANIGRPMAVVLIEQTREKYTDETGAVKERDVTKQEVISEATIRGVFSNQFNITGLGQAEARDLALLMRSGQLAAPLSAISERAIGPSLGQAEHRSRRARAADRFGCAVRVHDSLLPRVRHGGLDGAARKRGAADGAAVDDEGFAVAARHRRHPADGGHGGGRQRHHLRAHPRGIAQRGVAAGFHPRRLREGVLGHLGLQPHHPDRGPRAVGVRYRADPQLRHRAGARYRHFDVYRAAGQPRIADTDLRRQAQAHPPGDRLNSDSSQGISVEFFHKATNFPFMATRRIWYTLSVVLMIASIALFFTRGLNLTVDFTGGTTVEATFPGTADVERVRTALEEQGFKEPTVQAFGTSRDISARLAPDAKHRRGPGSSARRDCAAQRRSRRDDQAAGNRRPAGGR